MLLRYLDEILDVIDEIKLKQVVFTQHFFVEACYYYNDAISNSLKMIKDEIKDHPDRIKTYSDIDLKLLLDQIHQLRRDFEYEEKVRKKMKEENNRVNDYKQSFQSFKSKAEQTMNEIEICVLNFQLDIKITYSVDNYYIFEDLLDQLQNDLPEELDCFEPIEEEKNELFVCYCKNSKIDPNCIKNQKHQKPKFMQNLISKRFWLDNFGEIHHVEFIDFFEKFKNYVFETEKTNIDEAYVETLRKHLDVNKNLKVYSKGFDCFFTNLWSNFDFRKNFLAANHFKPFNPIELPWLKLECVAKKDEQKNLNKSSSPSPNKPEKNSPEIIEQPQKNFNTSITTQNFTDHESNEQKKDITIQPLVFGRKTRAFTPEIQLKSQKISNRHFQIAAYNKYKCDELNGYYIADLSLSNRTTLEVLDNQSYILDKGSLFEILGQVICVSEIYPRPNVEEEVPDLNWFHVPTHMLKSKEEIAVEDEVKTPEKFIKLNDIDEENIDLDEKEPFRKDLVNFYFKESVVYIEHNEEQKEIDKPDAFIKFLNEKWVLQKNPASDNAVFVYLINKDEFLGKEISVGCKLKNNMKINCESFTFKVSTK